MIQVRHEGASAMVTVDGNLTAGEAEVRLLEAVEGLVSKRAEIVEVDLGAVAYVDSSGLGSLVRSHTCCLSAGAAFRLLNVKPEILSIMSIARLTDVFDIPGNDVG
jgi:anti-sigma B factor antagonist